MDLLHQLKLTIRWHKTDSFLSVKSCQIDTLMKGYIIQLNCLPTENAE